MSSQKTSFRKTSSTKCGRAITPKVFPRSLDKLMGLTYDDDMIDAEFNVICRQEEYLMLEVPIFSTKRHGGNSTTNLVEKMGTTRPTILASS